MKHYAGCCEQGYGTHPIDTLGIPICAQSGKRAKGPLGSVKVYGGVGGCMAWHGMAVKRTPGDQSATWQLPRPAELSVNPLTISSGLVSIQIPNKLSYPYTVSFTQIRPAFTNKQYISDWSKAIYLRPTQPLWGGTNPNHNRSA